MTRDATCTQKDNDAPLTAIPNLDRIDLPLCGCQKRYSCLWKRRAERVSFHKQASEQKRKREEEKNHISHSLRLSWHVKYVFAIPLLTLRIRSQNALISSLSTFPANDWPQSLQMQCKEPSFFPLRIQLGHERISLYLGCKGRKMLAYMASSHHEQVVPLPTHSIVKESVPFPLAIPSMPSNSLSG